jgi:hypothetical protein
MEDFMRPLPNFSASAPKEYYRFDDRRSNDTQAVGLDMP